jgi:hypothetical protein
VDDTSLVEGDGSQEAALSPRDDSRGLDRAGDRSHSPGVQNCRDRLVMGLESSRDVSHDDWIVDKVGVIKRVRIVIQPWVVASQPLQIRQNRAAQKSTANGHKTIV